ncbi:MAG: hypothetical protein E4G99_02955, partial [Anaerolineales bacterium]
MKSFYSAHGLFRIFTVLIIAVSLIPVTGVSAQSASLVLSPSSGDPPAVRGTLSGSGWCTPASSVTVSGPGVTGSGDIGRDGSLSGTFSVTGNAGDVVMINISASCRGAGSSASARFRFNGPPTQTPIPMPVITRTPTSTSTLPATPTFTASPSPTATETSTPVALVQYDQPLTLKIVGCSLPATSLRVEFKALNLTLQGADQAQFEFLKLQLQDPNNDPDTQAALLDSISMLLQDGGEEEEISALPAVQVPVEMNPGPPQVFTFFPPEVNPTWLYQLTPVFLSTECGLGGSGQPLPKTLASLWFPGTPFDGVIVPPRMSTLTILGCNPQANEVELTFRRTNLDNQASGESIPVPVQPGNGMGMFVFEPPAAEPGALFALDLRISSPECPTGNEETIDDWTPGSAVQTTFVLPGGGSLLGSTNGKDVPGADKVEFKAGGVWSTSFEFTTTPKGHVQTFQWPSSLKWLTGGKLQASVLPFPSTSEGDLLNPPGLVATWDIECSDCVFSVDVSVLAPTPPEEPKPSEKTVSFFQQIFQSASNAVSKAWTWLLALFGGKQEVSAVAVPLLGNPVEKPDNSQALIATGKLTPPVISVFYFRVVPLAGDQLGGGATNPVRIRWYAEDKFNEGIKQAIFCSQNPGAPDCPTPVPPAQKPYTAEIVGFHGIIAPQSGHEGCYLMTKETTLVDITGKHVYPENTKFCPPKPKSKPWYEAVVDFVVDAVTYVSEAYDDLKATVVSIVATFVPDELCGKACLGTLLDAGLMALGIPPSIPNFDQLMNEGLDYLASQAAGQLGIPQEVYDSIDPNLTGALKDAALHKAEDLWKEEAEKQIKQGLQKGLEAAQYSLSESVSYVPDGLPV